MVDIRCVALVTAGSRGLGAEIVLELARQGADVAFTYLKDRDAAGSLVTELTNMGRRGFAIQADARDYRLAHEVVDQVVKKLGSLTVLVCNAGFSRIMPLWQMTEPDWDEVVDVSLKGAFNYIHSVAPLLISQKNGKIVCIGSINGFRGRKGTASYNAAKAGLMGLVKTAAAELGASNINVNLVAPGFVETPSQVNTPDSIRDLVLSECAIKRLGKPEDIAPLVAFLVSERARHITGQIIKVDAGQYL